MVSENQRLAVTLDASEVGARDLRERVASVLHDLGCRYRTYDAFWNNFPKRSQHLPKRLVVVADLAPMARHYQQVQDRHAWVASVRKSKLFFLALVRTKADEHYADLVDDLVRSSDARISVCRTTNTSEIRMCLTGAVAAFDPFTLADVRYSSARSGLGIQFSDGLLGFVRWADLGLGKVLESLILESATVGPHGRTVELSRQDGELFEIDAVALRSLLDASLNRQLQRTARESRVTFGQRLRSARVGAGLTQQELSAKSGIDQALVSKLERGQHQPRYNTLEKLAASLGLTVPELVSAQ